MSRRKPSLRDVDPIEVLFKAMRISETIAAREQQRGDACNLKLLNEAMLQAASLAKDIAAIQDRRGTAPHEPAPKVTVKIIGTCIHCEREFDVDELAPHRNPADKLPRTIDGEVVKRDAISPDGEQTTPVVKPKPSPPKPDFHPAQDFHKNMPVKSAVVGVGVKIHKCTAAVQSGEVDTVTASEMLKCLAEERRPGDRFAFAKFISEDSDGQALNAAIAKAEFAALQEGCRLGDADIAISKSRQTQEISNAAPHRQGKTKPGARKPVRDDDDESDIGHSDSEGRHNAADLASKCASECHRVAKAFAAENDVSLDEAYGRLLGGGNKYFSVLWNAASKPLSA